MTAPRVTLRHPRLADEREVLSLRIRNREFLEKWEPIAPPGHDLLSPEGFEAWVEFANSERRKRYVICRATDGVIMGQVSLSEIIRGPLQQAFMGYWIGEEFSRRGYMVEALTEALRLAFTVHGLHRVEANIQPHNLASIALVRRVGLKKEGFSPGYLQIRGLWADHERWAIRAEEFLAGNAPPAALP